MKKSILALGILLFINLYLAEGQNKILFDCTKAQTCTNADWQIDADLFNLGTGTGGIMTVGRGNEANPQRYPTPAWTTVTASTPETYWKGSLSSWGIAIAKLGYQPETLPNNGKITYNDNTNLQDLKNYKVFITDEPNIKYTTAEKTAIITFVQNGGGLLMISDHNNSDRNGDGFDSPAVLNDLITNNGINANPFGFSYDLVNVSQQASNIANIPGDSILHGPQGDPVTIKISAGTTITATPIANPNVRGLMYLNGANTSGNSSILIARSRFGNGRVIGASDSSPMDDGTGDPNDQLYSAWDTESNGDHARIFMNATIWLLGLHSVTATPEDEQANINLFVNSNEGGFAFQSPEEGHLMLTDMLGRHISKLRVRPSEIYHISANEGLYLLHFQNEKRNVLKRIVK